MTILERGRVLGIIRYRSPGDVRAVIDALLEGGVPLVHLRTGPTWDPLLRRPRRQEHQRRAQDRRDGRDAGSGRPYGGASAPGPP